MAFLQLLKRVLAIGHNSELIKSAGIRFILQVLGAGLALFLSVAIGRVLGASGAGIYYLALSVVSLTAVVARLGFENTVLRFVASFSYDGDWGQVRGVLRYTLLRSGIVSLVLSLIIIALSSVFEEYVFGVPGIAQVIVATGFAVLSINVMLLSSSGLQGLNRVRDSTLVAAVISPFVALVCLWPATEWFGLAGPSIAYLIGTVAASLSGLLLWRSSLFGKAPATVANADDMRASSRPLWISSIVIRGFQPWAPLILLGVWASPTDVGIYGASTRLALLISFFLIGANKVIAPKIAVLHKRGETHKIERIARKFALLATLIAAPGFLIAVVAGDRVMSVFGSDFSDGGPVFAILAFGQFINACSGPAGMILTMSGWEKDLRNMSLISAIFVLGLAVTLIPDNGAIGAATAVSAGYVLISFYSVIMVRIRLSLWIIPFFPRKTEKNVRR